MRHNKLHTAFLLFILVPSMFLIDISITSIPIIALPNYYPTYQFELQANPTSRECKAGETVIFTIHIRINELINSGSEENENRLEQRIFLSTENIPSQWYSKFSPPSGKNNFKSKLTIKTSASTIPGRYTITVIGSSFGQVKNFTDIAILITSTSSKSGSNMTYSSTMDLSLQSIRGVYKIGDVVKVVGSLSTSLGFPISLAKVNLLTINPSGRIIHFNSTETDHQGFFSDSFILDVEKIGEPINGTYISYATAKHNIETARIHTTFIVEVSSYPSVEINSILLFDAETNEVKSIYEQGESMIIETMIINYGKSLNTSTVWLEVQSPKKESLKVILTVIPLTIGDSKQLSFNFKVPTDTPAGLYIVKIFISNKPISNGGKFLSTKSDTFIVED